MLTKGGSDTEGLLDPVLLDSRGLVGQGSTGVGLKPG